MAFVETLWLSVFRSASQQQPPWQPLTVPLLPLPVLRMCWVLRPPRVLRPPQVLRRPPVLRR